MDSKSQNHSGPEGLDLVLAYILGDVTDEQRHHFENLLASGDPELTDSYQRALATFADLPFVLNPKTPPPFIKEKVMQRVQADAEQVIFETTFLQDEVLDEPTNYRHPSSFISKLLNLVPGYGNREAWTPIFRINPKRSLAFATLAFGGIVASAYGYTAVSHVLLKARQQEAAKVEIVKHSKVFQKEYGYHELPALPNTAPDVSIKSTPAVGTEDLAVAPVSENVADHSLTGAAATVTDIQPKHIPATAVTATKAHTDKIGVDMNLVDAQFYFTNDPTAIHFTLRPVNGASEGFGKIYWNDSHADALFTVSDLKPTVSDSRYVLYFTMDDGSMERVKTFQVISSAQISFFLNRAPGAHVTGAKLVLEQAFSSGNPATSPILTAATRVQASN